MIVLELAEAEVRVEIIRKSLGRYNSILNNGEFTSGYINDVMKVIEEEEQELEYYKKYYPECFI